MRFLKPGLIQAVCLAILLSACGGEEGRKAAYLEKGKAYFEEGNYDKAKIEFRNVLQIDPKFAEGFYMMRKIKTCVRLLVILQKLWNLIQHISMHRLN